MQHHLLWTGIEYYSLEHCSIADNKDRVEVCSTIIGKYEEKVYKVDYFIRTDSCWRTREVAIKMQHNHQHRSIRLQGDGNGNWISIDGSESQFEGCMDVDLPLTPFTNTLPIRRLQLLENQSREIEVIYCDVLDNNIKKVRQKYSCLSKTQYHYENVPNDFSATIEVDEKGFVIDYPSLFFRSFASAIDC